MRTEPDPVWLQNVTASIPGFAASMAIEQTGFDTWSCMPRSTYVARDVLDLGCGIGAASALFVKYGARSVVALDPELTEERIAQLSEIPRARFVKGLLSSDTITPASYDLVFARVVTEHIYDLPSALALIVEGLRPGGRFVGLHDNYYGPMGAHDQGLFGPAADDDRRIESKAVACWESPLKCEASKEFRDRFELDFDWHAKQWALTPTDCSRCSYYRRSRLWAHLLYQEEYPHLFDGDFFQTRFDGGLNKVTPYQLKQFLIESGLHVTTWECQKLKNAPPLELAVRFSVADLQTGPILFAAEKRVDRAESP